MPLEPSKKYTLYTLTNDPYYYYVQGVALSILDFSGLEQLNDSAFGVLKYLVPNLGKLKSLKCNGCYNLSDVGNYNL